ncbi:bifunctional 2-C-methyl-D-erythritol 4-phosphate cytidylyltransferase/2-C-methyl-D-erythritol 2,4-cyclodiphosphate synthase [Pontibacillus sp. ALD_SL1]|uniref:bifunctional 2-C-methyl-D-erythritol 4-phosphate cytidylyltransferase/2-C-methyl-D-erythritol 2,4-cyclodiphosphate synthase n=1 Tax=Pontibacillus sp. ALD_SL1 TaxID=2777185 RepID=UPI001A973427|nr:bifunctional 2-C-methyl-D-erythritol 4-phosphate cytidylyltransferase/2-C-methyl-D-erythritol 2,4-cyclodiphosphate synthase [Pontibacillus sp. ALD_SL1]QST00164.1 bifunctional 2-C-methyl-D-erythritol 4-phosphate cytidylyltransferase/2-C-methyl-D-erythritol 2,4-cyclodiphosphate synthase [Pontibacillus sp. ALD_SL1]
MSSYQVIILAAGQGKRMKAGLNKQFLSIDEKPLLIHTIEAFMQDDSCEQRIVVINPDERTQIESLLERFGYSNQITLIDGGQERQDSVYAGLQAINSDSIVLIHDGARPFVTRKSIRELVEEASEHGAALLAVPVTDTIKQYQSGSLKTLKRDELWAAQTPQAFRYNTILEAHEHAKDDHYLGTDDASLVERLGGNVGVVQGSYDNIKLTTPEDIEKAETIIDKRSAELEAKEEKEMFRVGQGFDVHQLVEGRPCIIGGIEVPYEKGLLGHSDADVLLHTVADACLGAIGEGDIGKHFPDTDPEFKDADSVKLLEHVWSIVKDNGFELGNIDCTIIAQAPKMSPYTTAMQSNIARILDAETSQVNVKATTTEKLGFPGRKEGVAAQATVLLTRSKSL